MQKIKFIRDAIYHCDKPDGFTSKDLHAIFGTNRKKDILQMPDSKILELTETIFDNRGFHSGDLVIVKKEYAVVMQCSDTEDKMWVIRKKDLLPMFVAKSECINTQIRNHLDIAFSARTENMFGFRKGDIVREVQNEYCRDGRWHSRFNYGEIIEVGHTNFVLVRYLDDYGNERYVEADTSLFNYRHLKHLDKKKQKETERLWMRNR